VGKQLVIRVLIADDQALVRAGFRALLDAQDDVEVVGEAIDGAEAVRLAGAVPADVVLMDIRMPGLDGWRRPAGSRPTRRSRRADRHPHHVRPRRVRLRGVAGRASGFLVKDTEPVDLLRGIRAVASGDALLSPGVTRRLIAEFAPRPRRRGRRPSCPA